MKPALTAVLLLLLSPPLMAQDDASSLDRIEVTGSRISYRDLLDTPAITITRRGDYLLQEIRLVNDSRSADLRTKELHGTIAAILAAAKGRYQLLHGDGYRIELNTSNYRVELADDPKREDTSSVNVSLRSSIGENPGVAEQTIRTLREFALASKSVGRTELDLVGETALGMNRPERYRYELIEAIADDSRKLIVAMKLDCKIELEGLNSRLEWERVSAAELLLYIPYSMTINDCSAGNEGN